MSADKPDAAARPDELIMDLARNDLRPSKIITREAIENAITAVCASGGSTNAVLHFLAIAREMGLKLTMDDFDRISEKTPLICDLKPGGKYVAKDYQDAGGIARAGEAAARSRPDPRHHDGDRQDASSRRPHWRSRLRSRWSSAHGIGDQANRRPRHSQRQSRSRGCVVKVAGHKRLDHRGPARVFETEDDCMAAVEAGKIKPNDVVVIRYEGPKGGPGMREMLP